MAEISTIDARSLVRERMTLKIRVVGLRQVVWRMKIAAVIFRLGAWVAGCRTELEL